MRCLDGERTMLESLQDDAQCAVASLWRMCGAKEIEETGVGDHERRVRSDVLGLRFGSSHADVSTRVEGHLAR